MQLLLEPCVLTLLPNVSSARTREGKNAKGISDGDTSVPGTVEMESGGVKSLSLDHGLQELKTNLCFTHRLNFWELTRQTLPCGGLSDLG